MGNNANGGESIGNIFYDVLTDGEQTRPNGKATSEIYDLDRYVNVTKYRERLLNYDAPENFVARANRNIANEKDMIRMEMKLAVT